MKNKLAKHRALEFVAMTMIGDGLLAAVIPERHVALWYRGPSAWQKLLKPFQRNPLLTRALGGVELGLGLWLAARQTEDLPEAEPRRYAPIIRADRAAAMMGR